jgi:hypothetical protein
MKYNKGCSAFLCSIGWLFGQLKLIAEFKQQYFLKVSYILSAGNPADALSRNFR